MLVKSSALKNVSLKLKYAEIVQYKPNKCLQNSAITRLTEDVGSALQTESIISLPRARLSMSAASWDPDTPIFFCLFTEPRRVVLLSSMMFVQRKYIHFEFSLEISILGPPDPKIAVFIKCLYVRGKRQND